jgi:ubiquinone/menaquinone biosynthesis C-methylase UbiE
MDKDLARKIILANIEVHQQEAKFYNRFHPEIFCASEQKLVKDVLKLALDKIKIPKIKVLDLGIGTGNIALKSAHNERVDSILGVDLSAEMLIEAEKKFKGNPKIKLVRSDLDSFLQNNQDKFDLITISSVLHHLPDYFVSLKNILGKLEKGGVLIIFHEPTGETSRALEFLAWIESRIFVYLYLPPNLKKLIKSLDYAYSDYHIAHGFSFMKVKEYIQSQLSLEYIYLKRHNVFKLGICRQLGKILARKNNFILGIKRL